MTPPSAPSHPYPNPPSRTPHHPPSGIIDIFTVYDATKRAERALKAVLSQGRGGPAAISAAPPGEYAARFRAAMARLFP
jgi:hypothetical protein